MQVLIATVGCKRCGHRWVPRRGEVRRCPACQSPYWDKERERREPKGRRT